ncbi:hypothetical protein ACIP6Q_37545 [Streptomyces bobili]|uniref:hypothetical protein n=1 Tax=Streptomyces bobili TaxID=67280 RepID=UPI003800A044
MPTGGGWLRQSQYRGLWREMVHRSALTLNQLGKNPVLNGDTCCSGQNEGGRTAAPELVAASCACGS